MSLEKIVRKSCGKNSSKRWMEMDNYKKMNFNISWENTGKNHGIP